MTAIDSHRAFSLAHHPRSLSPWPRYSEPVFNFSKASNFKERNTIWQRSHHWFIRFKSIQNEDLLKGHGGSTQNRSCVGTIYLFKTSWLGMRSPNRWLQHATPVATSIPFVISDTAHVATKERSWGQNLELSLSSGESKQWMPWWLSMVTPKSYDIGKTMQTIEETVSLTWHATSIATIYRDCDDLAVLCCALICRQGAWRFSEFLLSDHCSGVRAEGPDD